MSAIGDLVIRLTGKNLLAGPLASARSQLSGFVGQGNKLLSSLGTLAGGVGLGFGVKKAIDAARTQESAEKKLGAVLAATGGAAGYSKQQLIEYAGALQETTNFGDETTISAMAVLATFTKVSGPVFKQAIGYAQDMSAVLGTDLQSSTLMLGKALNNPTKGITALTRAGVSFSQQQIAQIKALEKSGDLLGAQAIILAELKHEFGGAAAAMKSPVAQMENAIGDLFEQIGYLILPAVRSFATAVKSAVVDAGAWLGKLRSGLERSGVMEFVAKAGKVIAIAVAIAGVVGPMLIAASAFGSVVSGAIAVVGVLTSWPVLVAGAAAAWLTFSESGQAVVAWAVEKFGPAFRFAKGVILEIVAALSSGDFASAGKIAMAGIKVAFFEAISSITTRWGVMINNLIDGLASVAKVAAAAFVSIPMQAIKMQYTLASQDGPIAAATRRLLGVSQDQAKIIAPMMGVTQDMMVAGLQGQIDTMATKAKQFVATAPQYAADAQNELVTATNERKQRAASGWMADQMMGGIRGAFGWLGQNLPRATPALALAAAATGPQGPNMTPLGAVQAGTTEAYKVIAQAMNPNAAKEGREKKQAADIGRIAAGIDKQNAMMENEDEVEI